MERDERDEGEKKQKKRIVYRGSPGVPDIVFEEEDVGGGEKALVGDAAAGFRYFQKRMGRGRRQKKPTPPRS
ncbi:MAG: hypothetical protein HYU35_02020 [Parcubacteria group bacterium]|nr:hypothetical protein [Parcubacteria group bacterium]